MPYLKWNEKTIIDFSDDNINSLYNEGYVFTRIGKGEMYQTRSLRIDLSKFELSSENKRILKKTENLKLQIAELPYENYSWQIGKLAKDFYETKFGLKTFSANKIKELLTTEHNFNRLFSYTSPSYQEGAQGELPKLEQASANSTGLQGHLLLERGGDTGYTICRETKEILHYSYPFYNLTPNTQHLIPNTGMGMMTRAIVWAKENDKKYIYLGSVKDEKAVYKLQFNGLEWFDGNVWRSDLEELKQQIKQNKL